MTTETTATQAGIARHLGISRQAVSKLIKNRERTGFPLPTENGLYNIEDVRSWYLSFEPKRGPVAGIRKNQN